MSEEFPTYQPAPNVLVQKVNGELVLLDLDGKCYFGLNEVGARIWQLLSEGKDAGSLVAQLLNEYEVERSTLQADVDSLLTQLQHRGLIQPVSGPAAARPASKE